MYLGKRGEAVTLIVLVLALIGIGVASFYFSQEGITAATVYGGDGAADCQTTVTESSTLTGDVGPCLSKHGLVLGGNDIEIDCNGYRIIGNYDANRYGVYNDGYPNITIKNCNLSDFQIGILFDGSTTAINNGTLFNNTLHSNTDGIKLTSSVDNIIINETTIFNSSITGIWIDTCNGVNVTSCNISESGSQDVYIQGRAGLPDSHLLFNNSIGGKINLDGSTNNITVYNNDFWNVSSIIDLGSDNVWNTTYDCSQTNIKGGRCVGGNFFSNYTGNDTDDDGIGNDSNYNAGSNVDYLPLVQVYSFTTIDPGTLGGDLSVNSTFNSTNPMTGGSVHSTSQN
ncbi:hypothetical protein HOC13_02800, partial [Candidatus Woesearchaeota archaeon]|nr:hypothetical protein [Candidatus Woesearchaeota archaeon]